MFWKVEIEKTKKNGRRRQKLQKKNFFEGDAKGHKNCQTKFFEGDAKGQHRRVEEICAKQLQENNIFFTALYDKKTQNRL